MKITKSTHFVSLPNAAEMLGCDRTTIHNYVSAGILSAHRMGETKTFYVDVSTILSMKDSLDEVERMKAALAKVKADVKQETDLYRRTLKNARATNSLLSTLSQPWAKPLLCAVIRSYGYGPLGLLEREKDALQSIIMRVGEKDFTPESFGVSRARLAQLKVKAIRRLKRLPTYDDLVGKNEQLRRDNKFLLGRLKIMESQIEALKAKRAELERTKEAREAASMSEDEIYLAETMRTQLADMDLSVRTLNAMRRAGIKTVGDLAKECKQDIRNIRNFGNKSFWELDDLLKSLDLKWGMDTDKLMEKYTRYLTLKKDTDSKLPTN